MTYYYLEVPETLLNKVIEEKKRYIIENKQNILNIWGIGQKDGKKVLYYPLCDEIRIIAKIIVESYNNEKILYGSTETIIEDLNYGNTLELSIQNKALITMLTKILGNSSKINIYGIFYILLNRFIKNEGITDKEIIGLLDFMRPLIDKEMEDDIKLILEKKSEKALTNFKQKYIRELITQLSQDEKIRLLLDSMVVTIYRGREISVTFKFKHKDQNGNWQDFIPVSLVIKTNQIDKYLESLSDPKKGVKHFIDIIQAKKILAYIYGNLLTKEEFGLYAESFRNELEGAILKKIDELIGQNKIEPFESKSEKDLFYDFLNLLRTDEKVYVVNKGIDIRDIDGDTLTRYFAFYYPDKNILYVNARLLYFQLEKYRKLLRFLELNNILIGKIIFRKTRSTGNNKQKETYRFRYLVIDLERIKDFVPEDFYKNLIKELEEADVYKTEEEKDEEVKKEYEEAEKEFEEEERMQKQRQQEEYREKEW